VEGTLSWNCVIASIVILGVLLLALRIARDNRRWRPMSLSRFLREFRGKKRASAWTLLLVGIAFSFLRLRTPLAITLGFGTVLLFTLIQVCGSFDQFVFARCLLRDMIFAVGGQVDPAGAGMCSSFH
jgi:hypothetical protein